METIGTVHTTSEYAEGTTSVKLSEQDAYAQEILRRSGLDFEVVDISKGVRSRLGARFKGVKRTPTLLDENTNPRAYTGVKEISQYISSNGTRKID